jgi:hypothetical protein
MATPKTRRPPKRPVARHPKSREPAATLLRRYGIRAAALAALAGIAIGLAVSRGGGPAQSSAGLPHTPDYHSLLVDSRSPQKLILGTHTGLYVSRDGGRHWRFDSLSGSDAMNLTVRPRARSGSPATTSSRRARTAGRAGRTRARAGCRGWTYTASPSIRSVRRRSMRRSPGRGSTARVTAVGRSRSRQATWAAT